MSYHDTHRDGIGCSEVSTILGLDPRTSPLDLWAVKRGLVTPPDDASADTERGVELEPAVLDWAERRLGHPLLRQGRDYEVPIARGHLLGSPDGIGRVVGGDRGPYELRFGVEAKTRGGSVSRQWGDESAGADGVPMPERLQCEAYMALMNAPRWYCAVLLGGFAFEFRLYEIPRDEARCAKILAFVESWWQRHIVEGIAPEAVTPEDHAKRARLLYPKSRGEILKSDAPEIIALMNERRDAEHARDHAKQLLAECEADWREAGGRIEQIIGDADGIETPVGSAYLNSPRTARTKLRTQWLDQEESNG